MYLEKIGKIRVFGTQKGKIGCLIKHILPEGVLIVTKFQIEVFDFFFLKLSCGCLVMNYFYISCVFFFINEVVYFFFKKINLWMFTK